MQGFVDHIGCSFHFDRGNDRPGADVCHRFVSLHEASGLDGFQPEALGSSYTAQASDAFIGTSSYHNRHFVGSNFKPII